MARKSKRRVRRIRTSEPSAGKSEPSAGAAGAAAGAGDAIAAELEQFTAAGAAAQAAADRLTLAHGLQQVTADPGVTVDLEALARESEAIAAANGAAGAMPGAANDPNGAAGLSGAPGAAPEPSPADILAGYKLIALAAVDRAAALAVPNWHVTAPEKDKLSAAIADACVLWFPEQPIPPKYLALMVIGLAVYEIAESRRDPATGKLPPRVAARIVKPGANNGAAAAIS